MKRGVKCLSVALGAFLIFLVLPFQVVQAEDNSKSDSRLDALRAAWRARTAKFDSVKFQWKEVSEYRPGSLIPPDVPSADNEDPDDEAGWPLMTIKLEFPEELILRGKWMKHASRTLNLTKGRASYSLDDYVSGFDGESSRMMFSNKKEVTGSIRNENRNCDSRQDSLQSLMYFARPFDTETGVVDPASLEVVRQNDKDGTLVVAANAHRRFVVDPNRNFIIISWEQDHPTFGGILFKAEIKYRKDEKLGWIPARWTLTCFSPRNPDAVECVHTGAIQHVEAGVKYPKQLFHIEFPVGARVYDHHTGKESIVPANGSKRDVSRFKR